MYYFETLQTNYNNNNKKKFIYLYIYNVPFYGALHIKSEGEKFYELGNR